MNNSGLHCECPSYFRNARATNIKMLLLCQFARSQSQKTTTAANSDCSFDSRKQNKYERREGISHSALYRGNYIRDMKRKQHLYSSTRHWEQNGFAWEHVKWEISVCFGLGVVVIVLRLLEISCLSSSIQIGHYMVIALK